MWHVSVINLRKKCKELIVTLDKWPHRQTHHLNAEDFIQKNNTRPPSRKFNCSWCYLYIISKNSCSIRHFYHYINVLDSPIKEYWGGNIYNISLICKALKITWRSRRNIRWTLKEVMRCTREGEIFQDMIKPINKVGQQINHLTWVIRRNSHRELDRSALWIPYDNAASKRAL